jgi:Protein of unknown function (DUF1566)
MRVQAVVPRGRGSAAVGPGVVPPRGAGRSGRMRGAFSGVQSTFYWSSTTNADNPDNAWNVNLNDGNTDDDNKDNTNLVWPVRGGA